MGRETDDIRRNWLLSQSLHYLVKGNPVCTCMCDLCVYVCFSRRIVDWVCVWCVGKLRMVIQCDCLPLIVTSVRFGNEKVHTNWNSAVKPQVICLVSG